MTGEAEARTSEWAEGWEKIRPLIVVGAPRTGTRFVTNVLNVIPGIRIYSEIRSTLLKPFFKGLQSADRLYRDHNESAPKNWEVKKRRLMYSVWAGLSTGVGRNVFGEAIYIGYKTPRHEMFFDFYNRFFYPVRPKYICCVRSFEDHFLSVQARWPHRGVVWTAIEYVRSLRQIRYMKDSRPEDVMIFVLDDYKREGYPYLERRVFGPLGVDNAAAARRRAERGAVNTAERHGVERKNSLNFVQRALLAVYPAPRRQFERVREENSSETARGR